MSNQIGKTDNQKYELIAFIGIILFILTSLFGWTSRSLWALAIIEVIILCLFLLFTTGLIKKTAKIPFSLKLFLFFSFLSVIFSVYKYNSIIGFIKILLFVIVFWIVTQTIKTIKQYNNITIALAITALIASIYGIINFFQLQDITLGVASFFGWRNIFAGYILLFLPLTLVLYLATREKKAKYLYGITTILLGANLYFTFSQASWLAFLLVFIVSLWFLKSLSKKQLLLRLGLFIISTVALVLILFNLHGIIKPNLPTLPIEEASSISSLSIQNRLDYWKTSLEIFTHYPILGVGLGNFKTLYTHYQQNIWSFSITPHNIFLLLLTEVGIFGFLAFLLFIISLFKNGLKIIRQTRQNNISMSLVNKQIVPEPVEGLPGIEPKRYPSLRFPQGKLSSGNNVLAIIQQTLSIHYISIGLLGGLSASLIHNLFDLDWEVPALFLIFFIEGGLLFSIKRIINKESEENQIESNHQILKPLFGFLIFIILSYLVIVPALTEFWNKKVDKIQDDLTQSETSIPILIKVTKFNPINADLYQNLSESYQNKILDHQGDREENQYLNVKYAKKAMTLDPKNSDRHQLLGYAFNFVSSGKDNQIQEAEKELKTAIEFNPNNNPYYYQILGFILFRQKKYQEALDILDVPLKLFDEESINKIFADQERINIVKGYLDRVKDLRDLVEKELDKE